MQYERLSQVRDEAAKRSFYGRFACQNALNFVLLVFTDTNSKQTRQPRRQTVQVHDCAILVMTFTFDL